MLPNTKVVSFDVVQLISFMRVPAMTQALLPELGLTNGSLDLDLLELSKIQKDLCGTFSFVVNYISEVSSGVLLDAEPRTRRAGFSNDLAKFGNQDSFSFDVPLAGQCSHLTTSSSELANLINDFILERDAGYCTEKPQTSIRQRQWHNT